TTSGAAEAVTATGPTTRQSWRVATITSRTTGRLWRVATTTPPVSLDSPVGETRTGWTPRIAVTASLAVGLITKCTELESSTTHGSSTTRPSAEGATILWVGM